MRCSVWRDAAENVAESLHRGTRVVVTGRLKSRSYETKEGEKRTVMELEVDEVGPSLRYASAKVTKAERGGGSGGGFGGGGGGGQQNDPWATGGAAPTGRRPAGRLRRWPAGPAAAAGWPAGRRLGPGPELRRAPLLTDPGHQPVPVDTTRQTHTIPG